MSHWTPAAMPDLTGKTVLVTGANSGIGFETAALLAARKARLLITCRGAEKARRTIARLQQRVPGAEITAVDMDLADLASVRRAAQQVLDCCQQLDVLVNNAGVMGLPLQRNAAGHEMLFAVNHLGHFAFTGLLMPLLNAAVAPRVVTVSSLAARKGSLPMDDLNWRQGGYSKMAAYGRAKLANLCFAMELQRRFDAAGASAISVAAHPGYAATNVAFAGDAPHSLTRRLWMAIARLGNRLLAQPAARGAWPSVYAASAEDVRNGDYYGPAGPFEFRGPPVRVKPTATALDPEVGRQLWQRSEELSEVRFL